MVCWSLEWIWNRKPMAIMNITQIQNSGFQNKYEKLYKKEVAFSTSNVVLCSWILKPIRWCVLAFFLCWVYVTSLCVSHFRVWLTRATCTYVSSTPISNLFLNRPIFFCVIGKHSSHPQKLHADHFIIRLQIFLSVTDSTPLKWTSIYIELMNGYSRPILMALMFSFV